MADTSWVRSRDGVMRWLDTHGPCHPGTKHDRLEDVGSAALAVFRLRTALLRFRAHTGPLQPNFAYGALSRTDFALAHALPIANHQDAITVA